MHRIAATLAVCMLATFAARGGDTIAITNWMIYSKTAAPPYQAALTGPAVTLAGEEKKDAIYWSLFDPVPLAAGKSVTFSARLLTPSDYPKHAGGQIRIGIYGVIAGTSPDASRQSDLRGFVVMGGANGKYNRIELHEHARPDGSLIHLAGLTNHAVAQVEADYPRGADARVVITIAKKSAGQITISGFWADAPFSFDIAPLAGDYTHLRALVLMRGGVSGVGEMKFSNVKIRQD